jgi:hypothetical protein
MFAVLIFFDFHHQLFKAADMLVLHPSFVLLLLVILVYSMMLAVEMLDTDPNVADDSSDCCCGSCVWASHAF